MRIKIITGYRKDQNISIDEEEAHKAYYLFFHPEARSSFSDGVALKGSDINRIEPDYQGSMGWNPTHTLDEYDMNEIRAKGIDVKIKQLMATASEVGKVVGAFELNQPLSLILQKFPQIQKIKGLPSEGMKRIEV